MSRSPVTLPLEVLIHILSYVIYLDAVSILSTSSLFYSVGQNLLHQDLTFTSISQLYKFTQALSYRHAYSMLNANHPNQISNTTSYLACPPRSLRLDVAGGASRIELGTRRLGTWEVLRMAAQCMIRDLARHTTPGGQERYDLYIREDHREYKPTTTKLVLETVNLRLNSHINDANSAIYDALSLLDTRYFIWRGPDPPHHFSTAIVMQAVPHLFRALSTYTRLTHLKLTNISFPEIYVGPEGSTQHRFQIPYISTLQSLYLGQSTFLSAPMIAEFLLASLYSSSKIDYQRTFLSQPNLQEVRLVDTYVGSIWGPRLRMSHIIAAAQALLGMEQQLDGTPTRYSFRAEDLQEDIEKVASIEVETERIEGGDRGY